MLGSTSQEMQPLSPATLPLRRALAAVLLALLAVGIGCARREPLTARKAEQLIRAAAFKREPVYAEVPQKVWWTPESPKDDYDELALRTLRNLEKAGLVTVSEEVTPDSATYTAVVTQRGFTILGTAPSVRGPVFRGKICEKVYDGVRNFVRHPTEETVGHAELVWHYANPTPLYPLFETRMDKPLEQQFASHVSFWFQDHQWKFDVNVRKAEATQPES
jgi:hypothetical protein